MTIAKTLNGTELNVKITGRLDTSTAPELSAELEDKNGAAALVFDLSELDYVSSAGLRVFLSEHKKMKGNMTISHPNAMIKEVLDITGFLDIFNIVD